MLRTKAARLSNIVPICECSRAAILRSSANANATTMMMAAAAARRQPRRQYSSSVAHEPENKIQVLPFALDPARALERAKIAFGLMSLKEHRGFGGIRTFFEIVKRMLGLPNAMPEPEVVQWKPIYLPVWNIDYSGIIKTRFQEETHSIELTAPDVPMPGTDVHPFIALSPFLPSRDVLQTTLEPFSASRHLKVYKEEEHQIEEQPTPTAMALPFSVFPTELPEKVERILGSVRNDDVRFPGDNSTALFAAYPIYVPYYLLSVRDAKIDGDGTSSTALMSGYTSSLSTKDIGFRFWLDEAQTWVPDQVMSISLELKAYRRHRPVTNVAQSSNEDGSDGEGTRPNHFSPRAAAQAAADSGSFDGAPHRAPDGSLTAMGSLFSGLEFKRYTETAANIINEQFREILRETVNSAEKLPTDALVKDVEKRMQDYPNLMAFTTHAAQNLEYMQKHSEMREAKESLEHAKAMPKLPVGSDQKVLTIAPKTKGFGINVKQMDAAGLEKMRDTAMQKAREALEAAEREAEACKPAWLKKQS